MVSMLLIHLALLQSAFSQIDEDSGVWVLNESNMDLAFSIQNKLLVQIYAPRCQHCENFAPEYEKVASRLLALDPPIHIAKINGIENEALLSKFNIKGFPTLLYFIDGEPTLYTGTRKENSIFSFVYSNSRPKIVTINTNKDLDEVLQYNKCNIILFAPKSSKEYEDFESVSKDIDGVGYIHTDSQELSEEFRVKQPGLVVLKNLRNERVYFDSEFSVENLSNFIKKNKVSIVIDFDNDAVKSIFGDKKSAILLLTTEYDKYKIEFETLSMLYRQSLLFCKADLNTAAEGKLASFLTLSPDEQPTAIIIEPEKNIAKYKLKGELTYDSLKGLIDDWINEKAERFYKSQPLPMQPFEGDVRVLVGYNFNEVVLDEKFDVVVNFYSDYCKSCEEFHDVFEDIVQEFKGYRQGLIFAKINLDLNDVEFKVEGMPMVVAFTKRNKGGIVYGGDLDVEFIKVYLKDVLKQEDEEELSEPYDSDSYGNERTDL